MPRPCCCEPVITHPNCTFGTCTGDMPNQVIADLPQVSNAAAGRFSTGGGAFLLDFMPDALTPEGGVISPHLSQPSLLCLYMGAVIGSECGNPVRPFASYNESDFVGSNNYVRVGYANRIGAGPNWEILYGYDETWILNLADVETYPCTEGEYELDWLFGFDDPGYAACDPEDPDGAQEVFDHLIQLYPA